jgi:hypothetical protein
VGGIKSEWWARSYRYGGRHHRNASAKQRSVAPLRIWKGCQAKFCLTFHSVQSWRWRALIPLWAICCWVRTAATLIESHIETKPTLGLIKLRKAKQLLLSPSLVQESRSRSTLLMLFVKQEPRRSQVTPGECPRVPAVLSQWAMPRQSTPCKLLRRADGYGHAEPARPPPAEASGLKRGRLR